MPPSLSAQSGEKQKGKENLKGIMQKNLCRIHENIYLHSAKNVNVNPLTI